MKSNQDLLKPQYIILVVVESLLQALDIFFVWRMWDTIRSAAERLRFICWLPPGFSIQSMSVWRHLPPPKLYIDYTHYVSGRALIQTGLRQSLLAKRRRRTCDAIKRAPNTHKEKKKKMGDLIIFLAASLLFLCVLHFYNYEAMVFGRLWWRRRRRQSFNVLRKTIRNRSKRRQANRESFWCIQESLCSHYYYVSLFSLSPISPRHHPILPSSSSSSWRRIF